MIFQPKVSKSTSLVASCEVSTTNFEGAVEEPFQVVFHLARKLRSCQRKNSTMVAMCIKISRFGEKAGKVGPERCKIDATTVDGNQKSGGNTS